MNHLKNSFSHIQQKLTPHTLGLLWITQGSITRREAPFNELNYFFEGILEGSLHKWEKPHSPNLLVCPQYQQRIHLGQVQKDSPTLKEDLNQFLKIMQTQSHQRKKILVIAGETKDFPSSLKKSYPSLEFEFLFHE